MNENSFAFNNVQNTSRNTSARWLASRPIFDVLLSAGLRGHARALLVRVPHIAALIFFQTSMLRALHVPVGLPAPAFLVCLAAPLLLRTDPDLALYGRYVVSRRLAIDDFKFRYADLKDALDDLLSVA